MGHRGPRVRVARGIFRDRYGLAATVEANGRRREKRFPGHTGVRTIQTWQDAVRTRLRTLPRDRPGTLADDIPRYIDIVKDELVSIVDRARHLEAWRGCVGHVSVEQLPRHLKVLNAALGRWRETLSASSCNQRRAALELVDLIRFRRPDPTPRWVPRARIETVLARLPLGTKTRPRLRLLHWTGMRQSQMGRLRIEDFRLDEPIPYVVVPCGKFGRLAAVPLVEEGLAAALDFIERRA